MGTRATVPGQVSLSGHAAHSAAAGSEGCREATVQTAQETDNLTKGSFQEREAHFFPICRKAKNWYVL